MIWTKGDHQSAKYQTFDSWREILPNLYFDRLLLMKIYKIWAKKTEELCLMARKSDKKFEKKLISYFKKGKNLVNSDPSTQKPQTFSLSLVPFVQTI